MGDQRTSSSFITCHHLLLPKLPAPKYLASELTYSHLTHLTHALTSVHGTQYTVCMLTYMNTLLGETEAQSQASTKSHEKAVLKEELPRFLSSTLLCHSTAAKKLYISCS